MEPKQPCFTSFCRFVKQTCIPPIQMHRCNNKEQAALSLIKGLAVILINFTLAQRGYLSPVGFC